MCAMARKRVPAYKQFLADHGHEFRMFELELSRDVEGELRQALPVRRALPPRPDPDRRQGRGRVGRLVGQPYNWVRSGGSCATCTRTRELVRFTFPSERRFVINAYSMGAWATGTNTGIAMARVAMVKTTGPDVDKIIDTLGTSAPASTTSSPRIRRS